MPETITYAEQAADVLRHVADAIAAKIPFALITSIGISGGSARPLGSLAMVTGDGRMVGYLSNGCIDRDIQLRGQTAVDSGERAILHYGHGSQFMDLKLPCGGSLKVLIDPKPDTDALLEAHEALAARQTATLQFDDADGTTVAFSYRPKFRLILAGRGAAFRATAAVAHAAGFELGILTPEEADLEALRSISHLPPVALTTPDQAVAFSTLDENAAFLTMFHDHEWEPQLLQTALKTPAAFVGCLGSRAAQEQRKALLSAMGVDATTLSQIRGPIGLVGGLRDAQLIAISAMAEIVDVMPPSVVDVKVESQDILTNRQSHQLS
ncbi:MAG: XdhC family protein [Pseudomonadota bacterium]